MGKDTLQTDRSPRSIDCHTDDRRDLDETSRRGRTRRSCRGAVDIIGSYTIDGRVR